MNQPNSLFSNFEGPRVEGNKGKKDHMQAKILNVQTIAGKPFIQKIVSMIS
jgi:hypothetical protein